MVGAIPNNPKEEATSSSSSGKTAITKEELLSLYILKLDEEANYFKVSPNSPEEELCDCAKCQVNIYLENGHKYLSTRMYDITHSNTYMVAI